MRLAHHDDLADASVVASVIEQSRRAVGAAVQRLPYPTNPTFAAAVVVSTARAAGVPDDDLALWLCAPSGRVDGDRPVDHVHEPERVAAALRDHFTAEW